MNSPKGKPNQREGAISSCTTRTGSKEESKSFNNEGNHTRGSSVASGSSKGSSQHSTGKSNADRKKDNWNDKTKAKKQANSKKVEDYEDKEEAAVQDAVVAAEDERETVVHPWHLNFVKHTWVDEVTVTVDDKMAGQGVYKIATHADNITGIGLFRKITGDGHFKLPKVWGNFSYVEKACAPLVSECLGKLDFDLKYLVPRALINVSKYVMAWPGIEDEIIEYLTSSEFSVKVVKHYEHKLDRVDQVLNAKCLRYAAKINAKREDVDKAVAIFTKADSYFYIFVFWWASLIGSIFMGIYWMLRAKKEMFICVGVCVTCYKTRSLVNINRKVRRILSELYADKFAVSYGSLIEIASSCSGGMALPPLLTCWKFKLCAGAQLLTCAVKKNYMSFGSFIAGANMVIPNGCHHDQYNGLRIRMFFYRTIDMLTMRTVIKNSKEFLLTNRMTGPWKTYSYDEWISHLTGRRGNLLKDAPDVASIKEYISVNIFVKLEAYLGKNVDDWKPRIIQGRQLEYQNIVGPYFYSMSKWIGNCFNKNTNLIYDSGLDARELGNIAMDMFSSGHRIFEIDVSNWDGSLTPEWIAFEVWFITTICPIQPHRWSELQRHWRDMRGTGKKGVSYVAKHPRRSGDMWTGSLNSTINLLILVWIFGNDNLMAVAKGDDNFFSANTNLTVSDIIAMYEKIGMKAKVKEVFHISKLGYCSGTFYPVDGGWKWGLKPFRILAKLGLNLGRHPPKLHSRLLFGTAMSMLPIGGHVPVLGCLLRSIVESGRSKGLDAIIVDEPWKNMSDTIDDVHVSAYGFFCDNYHMELEDVDDLEFMCTYNVHERRKLEMKDFPVVFEDQRFLKGFLIDAEVKVVPTTNNINIQTVAKDRFNWHVMFNVLLLSPLLEEGARCVNVPFLTLFLAIAEFTLSGKPFAICFHAIMGIIHYIFGFQISVLCHFAWNMNVLLSRKDYLHRERLESDYGSCLLALRKIQETRSKRRAGIFIPMSNCVALYKYRLMEAVTPLYCQWYNVFAGFKQITKKNQLAKKKSSKGPKPKKQQKGSLGRTLLSSGLGALGSAFGAPGSAAGSQVGNFLSDILGMGDYEVKTNSLSTVGAVMPATSGVPTFHSNSRSVRVVHREYLGDITSSVGFSLQSWNINPGLANTFPWLANTASNFQAYKFHGLVFEFWSTSASALNNINTALGTVIMATQYNAQRANFTSKAEMEQYEFTTSCKPSMSMIHPVECAPGETPLDELYIRIGALPAGEVLQFYDFAKFQLATVGMQNANNIGELWVSYDIELYKPRIVPGLWEGNYARISNGPYDVNNVLGTIQTNPIGDMGIIISATGPGWDTINIPAQFTTGAFQLTIIWRGVSTAMVVPTLTVTNLVLLPRYNLGNAGIIGTVGTGSTMTISAIYSIVGYSVNGSKIQIVGGTLPTSPVNVDIYISGVPLVESFV